MSTNFPPWHESGWPKLSETLTGERSPNRCQSCSAQQQLGRWLEHDVRDRVPQRAAVVVLCARCSARLIEPHPRLYRQLDNGEPFPGCMGICVPCKLRDGVACTSLAAQVNGGDGLTFTWDTEPIYAHVRVAKPGRSGFRMFYSGPVRTCSARVALSLEPREGAT